MKFPVRSSFIVCLLALGLPAGAQFSDIFQAVQSGNLEAVKAFLAKDQALLKGKNEGGESLLHLAAGAGQRPIVEFLLSQGLDIEVKNANGLTSLAYAAYQGHTEIATLLIDKGAEFKYQTPRGMSPLHFAAQQGQAGVVSLLLQKGAAADLKNQDGRTPVDLAVRRSHAEVVVIFLNAGLLDPKSELGSNALHAVAAAGRRDIVGAMTEKGADISVKAPDGRTIIHNAAAGGLSDLIEKALAAGQDVGARDNAGRTALYYAVRNGRTAAADLLLKRKADPNADTVEGRTLLHTAEDLGNAEMITALKKGGAEDLPRPEILLEQYPAGSGAPSGQVAYIANEGFRITTKTKTILVDALVRNPWNYDNTPPAALDQMIRRRPPYKKIDLLLFSHAHADHFNAGMAIQVLEAHPETILVGNDALKTELEREAGIRYAALAPRVKIFNPAWGTIVEETFGGVLLKIMPVNHADFPQEYQTLAYLMKVDGLTVFHLGDSVPQANRKFFESFGLEKAGIDIAFLDSFFLRDPAGLDILPKFIRPDKIIPMHMTPAEIQTVGPELSKAHLNLVLYRDVLEAKVFLKAKPKRLRESAIFERS